MFKILIPVDQGIHHPFIGDSCKKPEIINLSDIEMRRSRYIFVEDGKTREQKQRSCEIK